MRYITFSILTAVIFLSGCAFHGIMPEQYDGEQLTRDRDAINAYIDNGQILNPDPSRYPFAESTVLSETLDIVRESADGGAVTVESGRYAVPDDLEAGVYSIEIAPEVSSSAVVVYDRDGVRVFETSLLGNNNISHVILDDGYSLEFKTRFGTVDITQIQVEPVSGDSELYIPQGMYTVGAALPAGEYRLLSGELLIMRRDGTPEVYWNTYGESYEYRMERTMSDDYRPEELESADKTISVSLEEGDVIIAQKFLVIDSK